jgi:hypothetical protein
MSYTHLLLNLILVSKHCVHRNASIHKNLRSSNSYSITIPVHTPIAAAMEFEPDFYDLRDENTHRAMVFWSSLRVEHCSTFSRYRAIARV